MRRPHRFFSCFLLVGALFAVSLDASSQGVTPNYGLTSPTPLSDPELSPTTPLFALGRVQLAAAESTTGGGLSLQAGQKWFARLAAGRSLDSDVMSAGGGYRFVDGQVVSMHVTRQLGQERLGLAVRYDWTRSYLRLAYDAPQRSLSGPDMLRFSAGVRF